MGMVFRGVLFDRAFWNFFTRALGSAMYSIAEGVRV